MLEVAARSPSTKRLAESLQAQELKSWTDAGLSVDDVFRRLNLNTGLDDILTNPLFLTFNKYLVDFNTWNPGKSATMVETLARSYGDIPVARMLEAATKVDDTKAMATRLQGQQRDVWKDMGLNVDGVYSHVLLLDSTTGNLFENPTFAVWTKFVDDFSGGQTSSIEALWEILGEKTVVQKLVASRQTRETALFESCRMISS
uniref:RXLR phytopathogen effector protein WY-domain domain-containing protein n=1 Tax=Phytophthora ramorum TaxID=164328 RepID=H3GEX4_PHYRM